MYRSANVLRSMGGKGVRHYQSSTPAGVYGYRPSVQEDFEVPEPILESRRQQSNVYRWVQAFRTHGHRIANVNPVALPKPQRNVLAELDPQRYGLQPSSAVSPIGIVHRTAGTSSTPAVETVESLHQYLSQFYANDRVAVEFAHIESEHEREWLTERYEQQMQTALDPDTRRAIARLLLESQAWDNFLTVKFPTVKRYGAEGAESMMAFFRQIFSAAVAEDVQHIVLAMPHRGKLNLLTTMLGTRPAKIFSKFRGQPEFPADAKAMCDIASHFHASDDLTIDGKPLRISMLHNPSHLEAANPASMGKARSKQQKLGEVAFASNSGATPQRILNVQLHGDAAFAGQGINQEMLMMAGTPHFDVGGTIHMIVNNQIGFTTPGERGRVTRYSSDLAKAVMAPVFHVNGDDPEALAHVSQVAFEYQRLFGKDVFIDLNCFRRWGHNEVDDPTFTNPGLYDIIHARDSVPNEYARSLVAEGLLSDADVAGVAAAHTERLAAELLAAADNFRPAAAYYERQWSGLRQASGDVTTWDTGVDYDVLRHVAEHSVRVPEGFTIHPHLLKTHVAGRLKRIADGVRIDWATAEAMAFGSLMYQGHNVRLSGEDVGRGTFSHRHAMLVDRHTNEMHIPLNTLPAVNGCGRLEVANSILSEEAVLAFEYGMAIDSPHNLIVWEAQFGDFFNGAQIIIDAFIASAETKWMYANGLVMLLPHGYDGAASEHSSCRMERFLQLTDSKETRPDGDDVNLQVINPSTPAQYFHALRRQVVRDFRKPLVVVAPKILLRLAEATSTHADMAAGTSFRPVLGDVLVGETPGRAARVKRVILCSGKHYYALDAERVAKGVEDVAIVRVESLCPFPVAEINEELSKYPNASVFVWSQEEHRNMGAWSFVKPRFENMCGHKLKYYGRNEAATPAVGVSTWHKIEAADVVSGPFTV